MTEVSRNIISYGQRLAETIGEGELGFLADCTEKIMNDLRDAPRNVVIVPNYVHPMHRVAGNLLSACGLVEVKERTSTEATYGLTTAGRRKLGL